MDSAKDLTNRFPPPQGPEDTRNPMASFIGINTFGKAMQNLSIVRVGPSRRLSLYCPYGAFDPFRYVLPKGADAIKRRRVNGPGWTI